MEILWLIVKLALVTFCSSFYVLLFATFCSYKKQEIKLLFSLLIWWIDNVYNRWCVHVLLYITTAVSLVQYLPEHGKIKQFAGSQQMFPRHSEPQVAEGNPPSWCLLVFEFLLPRPRQKVLHNVSYLIATCTCIALQI